MVNVTLLWSLVRTPLAFFLGHPISLCTCAEQCLFGFCENCVNQVHIVLNQEQELLFLKTVKKLIVVYSPQDITVFINLTGSLFKGSDALILLLP